MHGAWILCENDAAKHSQALFLVKSHHVHLFTFFTFSCFIILIAPCNGRQQGAQGVEFEATDNHSMTQPCLLHVGLSSELVGSGRSGTEFRLNSHLFHFYSHLVISFHCATGDPGCMSPGWVNGGNRRLVPHHLGFMEIQSPTSLESKWAVVLLWHQPGNMGCRLICTGGEWCSFHLWHNVFKEWTCRSKEHLWAEPDVQGITEIWTLNDGWCYGYHLYASNVLSGCKRTWALGVWNQ